jgi:hypothetical protein
MPLLQYLISPRVSPSTTRSSFHLPKRFIIPNRDRAPLHTALPMSLACRHHRTSSRRRYPRARPAAGLKLPLPPISSRSGEVSLSYLRRPGTVAESRQAPLSLGACRACRVVVHRRILQVAGECWSEALLPWAAAPAPTPARRCSKGWPDPLPRLPIDAQRGDRTCSHGRRRRCCSASRRCKGQPPELAGP